MKGEEDKKYHRQQLSRINKIRTKLIKLEQIEDKTVEEKLVQEIINACQMMMMERNFWEIPSHRVSLGGDLVGEENVIKVI